MEIEPNISTLEVMVEMEIVPPHSTERGVCTLVVLIAEVVFPVVAIKRKGYDGKGLVGI